jgi:hypothetical protein
MESLLDTRKAMPHNTIGYRGDVGPARKVHSNRGGAPAQHVLPVRSYQIPEIRSLGRLAVLFIVAGGVVLGAGWVV